MALITEAGCDGDLRQRLVGFDHPTGSLKPAHQQEPVRAGGEGGAEMPRQGITVQSGYRLQFMRTYNPRNIFLQIVARQAGGAPRSFRYRFRPLTGVPR